MNSQDKLSIKLLLRTSYLFICRYIYKSKLEKHRKRLFSKNLFSNFRKVLYAVFIEKLINKH